MPSGSFWPNMRWSFKLGTGSSRADDWADYIMHASSGYVRDSYDSTCRELISNHITSKLEGEEHFSLLVEKFPGCVQEASITIQKRPPSAAWLQTWAQLYAWPSVFKKLTTSDSAMKLDLTTYYLSAIRREVPLSFSLFFLNRYDSFPLEIIGNPLKTIKRILDVGDVWFSGSGYMGYQTILTAYAVYYTLVAKGDLGIFTHETGNNGLVSYMVNDMTVTKTFPIFMKFLEEFPVVDKCMGELNSATVHGSLSIPELVELYRAKATSKKGSWA